MAVSQQRLQVLSEQVRYLARLFNRPGPGQVRVAHKDILLTIASEGPQAVPFLARIIGTSRQNVQSIIDRLVQDGCLEPCDNPAHKRSPLHRLTPIGVELLATMRRTQPPMLAQLALSADQIEVAIDVLQRIGQHLGPCKAIQTHPTLRKPRKVSIPPRSEEIDENELPVNLL